MGRKKLFEEGKKGGRETFVVVLGFLFVKYSRIFRAEGREERE